MKTVKVHEDTHKALKRLKTQRRKKSIDEVIREMVRVTTGVSVKTFEEGSYTASLTPYTEE